MQTDMDQGSSVPGKNVHYPGSHYFQLCQLKVDRVHIYFYTDCTLRFVKVHPIICQNLHRFLYAILTNLMSMYFNITSM